MPKTPYVLNMLKRIVLLPLVLLLATVFAPIAAPAQTLTKLTHQPPGGAGIAFLLTDGTVLAQGNNQATWWKLTPDITGSYIKGTWAQMASLPAGYSPDAFASAVLPDGRVVISGGEYNFGAFTLTSLGAIYDPTLNTWTSIPAPAGWTTIGDSPAYVTADGKFVVGQKLTTNMAEFDAASLSWITLGSVGKDQGAFNSEEGFTLLPDGTFVTADVATAPDSETYSATTGLWTFAGSTIVDLHSPTTVQGCLMYPGGCYYPPGEIGPQILRPDGTVFVAGGTPKGATSGHTATYHPASGGNAAFWAVGPDFPRGDDAGDSGAVLLTSGNVLVGGNSGNLYEFNGTTLAKTLNAGGPPVLMLPTGQAFVEGGSVQVYKGAGTYSAAWQPVIKSVAKTLTHGLTYTLTGTQLNGLSQAAAFGDEFETATNYPLVRITNNTTKHVFYARTHDHSSMGVATGSTIVSTMFDVPSGIELGASSLQVVTNGIPSKTVAVTLN